MSILKKIGFAIGAAAVLALAPAGAGAITFSGSSGSLASSVTFDALPGSQLQVVLTNTSTFDVLAPADILTGVFFSGLNNLTSVSAVLTAGSTVFYDPQGQPAGGVVGGEFAYATGIAGPGGATAGISSSGLNLFGGATFPGADLSAPAAVNGVNYGLLSAGDNTATANGGIINSEGQIKNSVTFVLGNYTGGVAGLNGITNVSFQYGTSLTEPNIPGGGVCANGAPNFPICSPQVVETPEPMSMAVLGMGLLGLGAARMRRRAA